MKTPLRFLLLFILALASPAWAGSEMDGKAAVTATAAATAETVPLDVFTSEHAYIFESDLNHGGSFGKQAEIQNEIEYGHRVHLTGDLYVHVGFAYDRFDFGGTAAPVPNHLQSLSGVIGIDFMHGSDVGAFIQVRPGFYTQNDFGISSFDIPITLGRIFVLKQDQLYVFAGVNAAFLRGGYPVIPLVGVIWIPNDQWRVSAVLPEPRLIYSPTKNLDFYLGGEFAGGSFRTDTNDNITPHKLSGAQVDFTDYRAGLGLTYTVNSSFSVDAGAGYSIQRHFAFHRAGENFRTDPSPFLRLELKASF